MPSAAIRSALAVRSAMVWAITRSMVASNTATSSGLEMKAAASTARAWGDPLADSAITGTCDSTGSRFCSSRNCQPSMTGIIRSSSTTSGGSDLRNRTSAAAPSEAVATSKPSSERKSASDVRMSWSSSTIRIDLRLRASSKRPPCGQSGV